MAPLLSLSAGRGDGGVSVATRKSPASLSAVVAVACVRLIGVVRGATAGTRFFKDGVGSHGAPGD
ncbi:MAG: hypothetical protein U5P41_11895 [Gammaproteobacteria bacterium]|nr:hypothetical protein [Gammaproteobacteria bacterium]